MKKQRIELKPGVKYRGHGYINDFGEFEFTPEQTGSRQGQRKVLKEGDGFSIAETKAMYIVHLNIDKPVKGLELVKQIMSKMNDIVKIIRDYEI